MIEDKWVDKIHNKSRYSPRFFLGFADNLAVVVLEKYPKDEELCGSETLFVTSGK